MNLDGQTLLTRANGPKSQRISSFIHQLSKREELVDRGKREYLHLLRGLARLKGRSNVKTVERKGKEKGAADVP